MDRLAVTGILGKLADNLSAFLNYHSLLKKIPNKIDYDQKRKEIQAGLNESKRVVEESITALSAEAVSSIEELNPQIKDRINTTIRALQEALNKNDIPHLTGLTEDCFNLIRLTQ